ncbi:sulfotransferase [Dokdonella sp.]|uniref:tetratricopeptide repeat-containing sulfotransferase family protein n=1 Tax=Dokdonella sp. TaxID=2291710 RepID=UPI0035277EF6
MQQLVENILAAMKAGQHADALTMSRELVHSFPTEEGALSLLAVSEQNAGDLDTAHDILLGLTRNHPGTWQHWNNLGNVQRLRGKLRAAGESYERALALNTTSPRISANYGLLQLNLGEFSKAREALVAACNMEGAEPSMRIWAGVACQACADDDTAGALIQEWQQWPRPSEEALVELGWLLFQLGDHEASEAVLGGEFQNANYRQSALARRVLALERLNRIDEAAALIERMRDPATIADKQARMDTLNALAIIAVRRKDFESARKHYQDALALELPQRYQRSLYFGLARAYDQLGDTSAAMDALQHAHQGELTEQAIKEQSKVAGKGLLELSYPSSNIEGPIEWSTRDAPSTAESPVFVVGFPRSGTTLLEQMLAAHPDFVSADEQPMLQRVLEQIREWGRNYPQDLSALTDSECASLRELYWAEAARMLEWKPGKRLVDKHPLNFLALPLIRRIFPEAPVIFCQRHPCDSMLSSYMQNFRDARLAAASASLDRLADLYLRLTARWIHDSSLFPQHLLYCRHEDLVSSVDTELQRIGEFLGLSDVSSMHQFSEHARARGFIGTPSYSQVVQGLNADAVGRWERYRKYLEPVLPTLAPILEYWGYEV